MGFNSHALMQDADDFDAVAGLAVENEMLADTVFAIPSTDVIAEPALVRVTSQEMNTLVELYEIGVPLVPVPPLRRVTAN